MESSEAKNLMQYSSFYHKDPKWLNIIILLHGYKCTRVELYTIG